MLVRFMGKLRPAGKQRSECHCILHGPCISSSTDGQYLCRLFGLLRVYLLQRLNQKTFLRYVQRSLGIAALHPDTGTFHSILQNVHNLILAVTNRITNVNLRLAMGLIHQNGTKVQGQCTGHFILQIQVQAGTGGIHTDFVVQEQKKLLHITVAQPHGAQESQHSANGVAPLFRRARMGRYPF